MECNGCKVILCSKYCTFHLIYCHVEVGHWCLYFTELQCEIHGGVKVGVFCPWSFLAGSNRGEIKWDDGVRRWCVALKLAGWNSTVWMCISKCVYVALLLCPYNLCLMACGTPKWLYQGAVSKHKGIVLVRDAPKWKFLAETKAEKLKPK